MQLNQYKTKLAVKLVVLFAAATGIAWLLINKQTPYAIALTLLSVWLIADLYRLLRRAHAEVQDFAESVHYRDFSRHFNVKKAPLELQPLRKGFNEINDTFKEIRGEREMQYQYLQKILELVDTGIISFKVEEGEINWVNDTFRRMLDIPYLRSIESLEKRDAELYRNILDIAPGESRIVTQQKQGRQIKMLINATVFQTDNIPSKIVALQNVNEALDETEAKAWQKLLSVMTHEIMNSVAPISSLADTLRRSMDEADVAEAKEDLELGLETIRRRSEGLLRFAESYRSLNKITQLNLQRIAVSSLFENLTTLMQPTLDQKGITLETILREPRLEVLADSSLLEQVLINLLLNAMDAVKGQEEPTIVLSASILENKTIISVRDNGSGIEEELMDKIFVPFFSTKKTGSGIGLSLCKQIMLMHKGNIHATSVPGQGTSFVLTLNA